MIIVHTVQMLSDIALTITPLVILWRVNLPSRSKLVIRVAFSGSVLMLVLFIACYIVWFSPGLKPKPGTAVISTMISQLEVSLSTIISFGLLTSCRWRSP